MAVNSAKAINKQEKPIERQVLSSNWGALDPNLIATITPIIMSDKKNSDRSPIYEDYGNESVSAPIVGDASMSLENNYNSPFESSNPNERVPALMAMLQSGAMIGAKNSGGSDPVSLLGNLLNFVGGKAEDALSSLQGKTNFTKMNSQMVYVSSSAPEFTITLLFRAWINPQKEVEIPIKKLMEWSVPQELGYLPALAGALIKTDISYLFPSKIPLYIKLKYAGKTYYPLEVKSISVPLTAPMDTSGNRLVAAIELSLGGVMALDKSDIERMYVK